MLRRESTDGVNSTGCKGIFHKNLPLIESAPMMIDPPTNLAPLFAASSLAQWVGAVATTAAVLYALYRDAFAVWFNRPRLTARIAQEPPDCLLSPVTISDTGSEIAKSYWLRLWVQNVGRGNPAEQVQVFVHDSIRGLLVTNSFAF